MCIHAHIAYDWTRARERSRSPVSDNRTCIDSQWRACDFILLRYAKAAPAHSRCHGDTRKRLRETGLIPPSHKQVDCPQPPAHAQTAQAKTRCHQQFLERIALIPPFSMGTLILEPRSHDKSNSIRSARPSKRSGRKDREDRPGTACSAPMWLSCAISASQSSSSQVTIPRRSSGGTISELSHLYVRLSEHVDP